MNTRFAGWYVLAASLIFSTSVQSVEVESWSDFDQAIPDEGQLDLPIEVADSGIIQDLTVRVSLAHTWVGDLTIRLESPTGRQVTLMDRPGEPDGDQYGYSTDLVEHFALQFVDGSPDAAESMGSQCLQGVVGQSCPVTYAPDQPLSDFQGEDINGVWTLVVTDSENQEVGSINSATLTFDVALLGDPPLPQAQEHGALENPANNSHESGIGILSGWHCDAQIISVQFNDQAPVQAAYGTERNDTLPVCGDADNGFGLLYNFNLLGDGQHTVRVFADGVQFAQSTIEVTTIGGEQFIGGARSSTKVNSLSLDRELQLQWQESKQNYVIVSTSNLFQTAASVTDDLVGLKSGSWNGPGLAGNLSMTFEAVPDALVGITGFDIDGVACNGAAVSSTVLTSFDDPEMDVDLVGGSTVRLRFLMTNFSAQLAGTLEYIDGDCEGIEGTFTLR